MVTERPGMNKHIGENGRSRLAALFRMRAAWHMTGAEFTHFRVFLSVSPRPKIGDR